MNLKTFNTLLSLVFAPSFIILMQFFSFLELTFSYALAMFVYLIFSIAIKSDLKTISTPLIYFVFIVLAYYFVSMESIKIIPALISGFFFLFFLESFFNKRKMILNSAKKFYSKGFSSQEEQYIGRSDGYWAVVTFINLSIQIALVFVEDNTLWAFYSSVGWYIFLGFALVLQIAYGKIFVLKAEKSE